MMHGPINIRFNITQFYNWALSFESCWNRLNNAPFLLWRQPHFHTSSRYHKQERSPRYWGIGITLSSDMNEMPLQKLRYLRFTFWIYSVLCVDSFFKGANSVVCTETRERMWHECTLVLPRSAFYSPCSPITLFYYPRSPITLLYSPRSPITPKPLLYIKQAKGLFASEGCRFQHLCQQNVLVTGGRLHKRD